MADDKKADESTVQKKADDSAGTKQFDLDKLRGLLTEDGYGVPDHITDHSEFLEHLNTAALSKKAMVDKLLGEKAGDDDALESGGDLPPDVAPAPGAPVMMSLAGHRFSIQPAPKKGKKKVPDAQLSLGDERSKRLEKALLAERRQTISARIESLFQTGRITKPIRDKLVQVAGTVQLALDDSGQLASNAVLAKVEAYEELSAGSAWPNTGELPPGVVAAPPSPSWGADDSTSGVQGRVNDFFATVNRK